MKVLRWMVCMAAVALFTMGGLKADEITEMKSALENMKKEMSDMKAKFADEMQAMKESAGGEAPDTLMTKGGAKLQISGEATTQYQWVRGNTDNQHENKITNTAGWGNQEANMKFNLAVSDCVSATLKLDLDDANNANTALLEEAYVDWKKLFGTDLGVRFGKHEIAYGKPDSGATNDVGVTDAFVHGGDTSFVDRIAGLNPIGELDNRYGLQLNYKFRDLAKIEATIFSNQQTAFENKSTDSGIQNFATQITVNPIEKLSLIAGFIYLYNESAAKPDHAGFTNNEVGYLDTGAWNNRAGGTWGTKTHITSNQYEMSLASTYKVNDKLSLTAQYLRTWAASWVNEANINTFYWGGDYKINNRLTLGGSFEYMQVRAAGFESVMTVNHEIGDDQATNQYNAAIDKEELFRTGLALRYNFDNGIFVGCEWLHEWYQGEWDHSNRGDSLTAGNQWQFSSNDGSNREADAFTIFSGITF